MESPNGGRHESDEELNDELVEVVYDDDNEYFEDDDDDGNEGTDQGDMADVEDEGEETDSAEDGDNFAGERPALVLKGHQDAAVFCCSFDASGERLITGGEDDVANVWDSTSIQTHFPIYKCRGHKDSVISAGFSFDTSYFFSADLSGVVKVWKMSTLTTAKLPVLTLETSDLTWSFWHFGSNVLFAGCEDGSIYMWKVPSGECKILAGDGTKCECATLLPDGKRLVAGYESGSVKLFELKSGQVQHVLQSPSPRTCAILCIDKSNTHQVVATGDFKGRVSIYNTQTGKHLGNLHCSPANVGKRADGDDDGNSDSVESIAFCPDQNMEYIAAGTVSGNLAMWDITNLGERVRLKQEAGLTKIIWNPTVPLLYTGGLDGIIRVIDARTCKIERLYGRHRSEVLDLSVSRDGSKLVSASEDGSIFVFTL